MVRPLNKRNSVAMGTKLYDCENTAVERWYNCPPSGRYGPVLPILKFVKGYCSELHDVQCIVLRDKMHQTHEPCEGGIAQKPRHVGGSALEKGSPRAVVRVIKHIVERQGIEGLRAAHEVLVVADLVVAPQRGRDHDLSARLQRYKPFALGHDEGAERDLLSGHEGINLARLDVCQETIGERIITN